MEKKKSLGQHFLYSKHYLAKIADAAELAAGDLVLEVGPGDGTLTRELLAHGTNVIAIEKDHRLIPLLRQTFTKEIASGKLRVIEGDILHFDISKCFPTVESRESYKVVANIPYYITGAILEKFLSARHQPSSMTLLVQKEVAQRITGHPSTGSTPSTSLGQAGSPQASSGSPKESILSLSVKVYGDPAYVCTVPRGTFAPPPDVDSAVLVIKNISRRHFSTEKQEERFFALLHAGFAHKRKLLARNLEPLLGKEYPHILENVGISANARAEDLPLEQWLKLSTY